MFLVPTIFGEGVIISWHYIFTPDNIWWLYCDITFLLLTIFGEGLIILWHYIFTPDNIWWGCVCVCVCDYIVTLHFHSWQYLVRGWLYCDITFLLLKIFGEGLIILWHYIFTPDNIWWGCVCVCDYIVTLHFHSWQYLVRGWLYCDITFLLLTIFGKGLIILWHYIFTPDNIWGGDDDYIVTLHSLLTIFGEGGDYIMTLLKYIFTPYIIWWGGWGWVIMSWHYIFTPENRGGADYIITLHFHSWQYLGRGMIISWHYIFTADNIWWWGDYIMTLNFHSWQYLGTGVFILWY